VEVTVVVEAARLRLDLAALEALGPGQVLPAGRPVDGVVELSVGGRRVARGVLVDVEGELGVRIVEVG
jgi:flagellar motor switch/type III secretory pathway protein FliN